MFNALKYTQELEKAGFTREQAEAALNMIHQFGDQNLATKTEMIELRSEMSALKVELKSELSSFKSEMKHSMESLEHRMTIKLGSMLIVAMGVLVALQKLV